MNEVVEAEKDGSVVNVDVEDVEGLDVHNRSGLGCLTSMASHTGVRREPMKMMYWMKW